jgi:hypothetical protein
MQWFLNEAVKTHSKQLSHGDKALFIGSCFSEHIYQKGRNGGFNFLNTKFGTIFHPLPIARILLNTIEGKKEERLLERDNRFYSWDAYSKFNAETKAEMSTKLVEERFLLNESLNQAKFLFITLGTAKEYVNQEGTVVANCHKLPPNNFTSQLTDLALLIDEYKILIRKLKYFNPEIEIVLTVSPVRHSKDGLITNNRSKARLLMLCEELSSMEGVSYFPAYEMVVDELRDYRFYAEDLVHPNAVAVNYVWEKFQETYMEKPALLVAKKVEKYRNYFNHIPLNSENDIELEARSRKKEDLDHFLKANPKIIW